jgi:hypothetical protein
MNIPKHREYIVYDFFHNFTEITNQQINQYGGYWGLIVDARLDNQGTLWINSGRRENLSVAFDKFKLPSLYEDYGQFIPEDLAGSYILVFGILKVTQYNKRYIVIDDAHHYALRLPTK